MFQDIDPHTLRFNPAQGPPNAADHLLVTKDGHTLLEEREGQLTLPTFADLRPLLGGAADEAIYLFSVGDRAFYSTQAEPDAPEPFAYRNINIVRSLGPAPLVFASATAFHLGSWYKANRFCGQCADAMRPKPGERALACPRCGLVLYPRISPAIIVGIIHGDRLLLTKYTGRHYKNHALIAGFVEPGETLEATVEREVMEEVGLRVANLRYYKSQPWAFSQSLLMGFFADLQGAPDITLDTGELAEAVWFRREDIPVDDIRFSLTWDMMQAFRNNEV